MKGIKIDYDDDGNAIIPESELNKITADKDAQIRLLQQQLNQLGAMTVAKERGKQIVDSILGESEESEQAGKRLYSARDYVDNFIRGWQIENNISGVIPSGDAIDLLADTDFEKEYNKKFPDVSLEDAICCEDSPRHLRTAVQRVASKLGKVMDESVDRPPLP